MNDQQIRRSFHNKRLRKHHVTSATIVVDELGLHHGRRRADIAVINGKMVGYEIKSDVDSLRRLVDQIDSYNSIFDLNSIIVTERYLTKVTEMIPQWWGIILASEGLRGAIHFRTVRRPKQNSNVDDLAVARLLWRCEAKEILSNLGVEGKKLREKRENLYQNIIHELDSHELRRNVRECLKKRPDWPHSEQLSPNDDLSQPVSRQ